MNLTHSKKAAAVFLALGGVAVSASTLSNSTAEPSFLFLGLLGLGIFALGRLRRA